MTGGWQPIADAPRDGTRFDIWVPTDDGGFRVCDVAFNSKGSLIYRPTQLVANLPRWPTHWMPLPASPAEAR